MRIHTDVLTHSDLTDALRECGPALADVFVNECNVRGSRSRARAFEVRLSAEPKKGRRRRNTGQYGAEDAGQPMFWAAATYDEHGLWMARLFEKDPNAVVGYYEGRADFHRQTDGKFRLEVTA